MVASHGADDVISKISSRHTPPPSQQEARILLTQVMMSLVTTERSAASLWATYESQDSKSLVGKSGSLKAEASLGVLSSSNHTGGDIIAQGWNPMSNPPLKGVSGGDLAGHGPGVRGRSDQAKS